MASLSSGLRKKLEKAVVEARRVAEEGTRQALESLTVHEGKRGTHLSETNASLRNRLRAHARQIGDRRNSQSGTQAIERLTQECAYEHWHRMIFARFLAENDFLVQPASNVAVSLEDVEELAQEAGVDLWTLAGQYASVSLPAVFRTDDPLLELELPRETRLKLEQLLEELATETFKADDSLGWVYQFWQSEEKDRVNSAGEKINGRTLPAVTQLFTEHYMVLFLLHNTLGAWYASKALADQASLLETAKDEDELRRAVAMSELGGYEFEYLRFVREPTALAAGLPGEGPNTAEPEASASGSDADGSKGSWRPMGGAYDGWPKTTAELKVLDPSCGSGHFLVAAFELLVRLRMHEEDLSVRDAVDAVLSDNLFGLEIDPRCTQIAAFNLSMAAWKLTGPRPLPPMRNIACSGIPVGVSRDEWMKIIKAEGLSDLMFEFGQLYDMFSNADTLGSLINPGRYFGARQPTDEQLEQLTDALEAAVANDPNATLEEHELSAAAQGLTRATELLGGRYDLVITNVPYLGRGKQDKALKSHLESQYGLGKADLATAFVLRCLEFCTKGGSTALVTPQNWLFLTTYKKLRESLLNRRQWGFVARLGPGAFETIGGHVVNVALLGLTANHANDDQQMAGIDVSAAKRPAEKAAKLCGKLADDVVVIPQKEQLKNPDARIAVDPPSCLPLLKEYAICRLGLGTGDAIHYLRRFWELPSKGHSWQFFQNTTTKDYGIGGFNGVVTWDSQRQRVLGMTDAERKQGHNQDYRGREVWGRLGISVSIMSSLKTCSYEGSLFDKLVAAIVPNDHMHLAAITAYVESEEFTKEVRRIDQKLMVTNATLVKVPFDLNRWKKIAAEKYPNGLPEPESDDPTQWLFHGRPEQSTSPLQVAVARMLGYRWPAETDLEMRLSDRARELVARCSELDSFVDDDGIACIPSIRGEDPAVDRLARLLAACDVTPSQDLDAWLRNEFFKEHCNLFHQRPFVWHIYDGRKQDGFHALVNYHKLAGPGGRKVLESLTYSYLGDWITLQEDEVKRELPAAEARLLAARELFNRLEAILEGEPPYDLFVRWKPLGEQAIGWEPDINDGVRMNIRPFMAADLPGVPKGAGVFRVKPKIKWSKDRGKEPKRPIEDYPWFWGWDEETENFSGESPFTGVRWNDCHYTNEFKLKSRKK